MRTVQALVLVNYIFSGFSDFGEEKRDNWSVLNVIETIIPIDRSNYIRKVEENYNSNPARPLVVYDGLVFCTDTVEDRVRRL